jgi:hypothetical protein
MFGFPRKYDVVEGIVVAAGGGGHVRVKPMPHRWSAYPTFEIRRRLTAGLGLQRGELVRMRVAIGATRVWVSRIERMFGDAAN